MKSIIRSLRHRNFRLYFFGQGISVTGTWMQSVAMLWLVYRLTGSKTLLGLVGFTSGILTFVVAPVAGVLADRWDRRRALIAAQAMAMVQALAMAAVVLTGVVEVWQVIALSVFTGFVRGFEVPTRQSFIVQMLDDREDLPNAIALNSFMVNGARLIGPVMAGVLIAAAGEGMCFLLNGLSYGAVIAALAVMRVTPRAPAGPTVSFVAGFREGLAYARGSQAIWRTLLLLAVVSLMAVPYTTLMPVFAKDILGGGPHTMGFLTGATGFGALAGAAVLASRRRKLRLGRMILVAALAFGAGLIGFGFSRHLAASLPLLAWAGGAMMVQTYSSNTLLQTISDEGKRGRVMSFYTMAFMGMIPFGNLLVGCMAEGVGAPWTVVIGGAATVLAALLMGWRLPRVTEAPPATAPAPAAA